ncbi:MAG: hypothetical protein PHN88_11015 [Ignavibacteria bacterium]|nr:hypothetical protein [Ignavibacteria bacterium]
MEETITQQAIRLKKEKVIKGITCPSCSGELDISEGVRTLNCKYCGTLLVAKDLAGSMRFYVPRKLKREDAINKAYNWLGSGLAKAKGLKANSKITEAYLAYIPYWRVSADAVGWIFGQEEKTRSSGNSTETYYEDVEKRIMTTFDRTYSACEVSELGVKHVNLTGDEMLPMNAETLQRDGMLFNVVSSEKDAFDSALEHFKNEARASAKVDRVTFEHIDLIRKSVSVVYYPLWVVRYSFANRVYQVVVDGDDGTICYGKAPGNNLYRAVVGIIGMAAGMFLTTFFGAFMIARNSAKFSFAVFIIAFIIGIVLIRGAYKKFRYGGEVEQGTGIGDDEKSVTISQSMSSGTTGEVVGIAKNVAASAVVGAVLGSIFNSD